MRITKLSNTININDLCELLQAPELAEIKQPNDVAKWYNSDTNVGSWGHELLDLCCDVGLFILNGRHLVTNQVSSFAWQMGGATLSIILLVRL